MKPCWSCNSNGECYKEVCECAKCMDPEGYEEWKNNDPEGYDSWLKRQEEEDG